MRLAFAALALAACTSSDARPRAPRTGHVVIELFTSQGCSSCPPADRLLSELASDRRDDVIALAYHVDYWDDLGWADPFARADWSDRQRAYAGDDGRVYTPALVVNGGADVVGSQRRAVAQAIADATPLPGLPATARLSADRATLRVEATAPAGSHAAVALYEDGLTTAIARGENAGVRVRNDRVVRALVPFDGAVAIPLAPGWDRRHLGAVVLAAGDDRRLVAAQPLAF